MINTRWIVPIVSSLLLLGPIPASAIVTLGTSAQNFGLTGIGGNANGQGQSKITWGSCTFDGTTTTCTLSGPFTGLGNGGTYSFIVSYPGNGAFPLNAVSQTPGADLFFAQATGNFSFMIVLAQTGGPTLTFYDFANFNFLYSNSATCTGVPATGCGVGQVGLTPNATISGPITGSFDPRPTIRTSLGVITAGGYGAFPSIAPSTWMEIYGVNLATTRMQTWTGADFNGSQAPSALGGTTVTVAGKPAFIDYVSPGQVNAQVPSGIPTGMQPVVVTTGGGMSTTYMINVNPTQPGLLAPASAPFLIGGKQHVVAFFSNTLSIVLPVSVNGVTTARARVGDKLTLYGIGFGPVTPDLPAGQIAQQLTAIQGDVKITFAGVPADLTYSGFVPGNVGLYQFNVVVPNVAPSDSVPVAFTLGGVSGTQNLVIAIQ